MQSVWKRIPTVWRNSYLSSKGRTSQKSSPKAKESLHRFLQVVPWPHLLGVPTVHRLQLPKQPPKKRRRKKRKRWASICSIERPRARRGHECHSMRAMDVVRGAAKETVPLLLM